VPISAPEPLLDVHGLQAGYGKIAVLHGVDLHIAAGEVVSLLGPNGAGKTTLLRAIAGLLPLEKGKVVFGNDDITHASPLARRLGGISYVPQERNVFPNLSVLENLEMAYGVASTKGSATQFRERLDFV